MTLRDLIKSANETLGLPIDWDNTTTDENYRQLFACTRLVLNTLTGGWSFPNNYRITDSAVGVSKSTLVYGVLTEYAFVAGMFNEWKVWNAKYRDGLFKANNNGKTRRIPAI